MSTLYLVSTPIGNLSDITRRAAETLEAVDAVLAEDTRHTRKLLDHLGTTTPLLSVHEHNEAARIQEVLDRLDRGESLALVTDAGTPLVSDPGARLVAAVVREGHRVVPVPGPSAVLAALVASGLPPVPFAFLGFPPRKGGERHAFLERVADSPETVVLFESPGRLVDLLEALEQACGPDRRVAVGREITKIHEEFFRGTLAEARAYYESGEPRGEVTLVVAPGEAPGDVGEDGVDERAAGVLARSLLEEGTSPSRTARQVARRLGIPRNEAYRIVQDIVQDQDLRREDPS